MYITLGKLFLGLAFATCGVSAVLAFAGYFMKKVIFMRAGALSALANAVLLTLCCGILEICFLTGDTSIAYVVEEASHSTGSLAVLFKIAGLWGGSEGSLLFWAWLISVFCAVVAHRVYRGAESEDAVLNNLALGIAETVLLAFLGVLFFSRHMPFVPLNPAYLNPDGTVSAIAQATLGMNMLLVHWAMAVHPPTLFIGYAGFTMPFAYALAALIAGDPSDAWVRRSTPFAMVSWLFLTIGIGLGAVWAYVVLGWGGYWGWDPVENASLLPWLMGLALIHSFTLYRRRGSFKRWAVVTACLTFTFVILGTFITRSGLVESVHAFEGDQVSLDLFLGLIIASALAAILGVVWRWKLFASDNAEDDDIESFASRDAAYYVNNLIAVIFTVVLAYFTISSALPSWMPLGGMAVSTGTYESIARPLGILYCALMAVCPLLSWRRTAGKDFWARAKVPGICAVVAFAGLLAVFFTKLLPSYRAVMASGGTQAAELYSYGPSWYYNGLAVVGLLVACLLFFNALFLLAKILRTKGDVRSRLPRIGGFAAHLAMGVILVGLIGSSMYVNTRTFYLPYDEDSDTVAGTASLGGYELTYTGSTSEVEADGSTLVYTVGFDVMRDGAPAGHIAPRYHVALITGRTKLDAGVLHRVGEDLFVVFSGFATGSSGGSAMVLEVRTNPLIGFVWTGFVLMMVGMLLASCARRSPAKVTAKEKVKAKAPAAEEAVEGKPEA